MPIRHPRKPVFRQRVITLAAMGALAFAASLFGAFLLWNSFKGGGIAKNDPPLDLSKKPDARRR